MADNDANYQGWHWRNSMKPVRFFRFDARAGFFLVVLLIHARLWTLGLAVLVFLLFWILERNGLSFSAAIRTVRRWFIGAHRPAWIYSRRRKFLDTGSG
ncbi:MAG: type IV secretion protein IcmT [Proteobacteria bacterium]|nr:type IV secretion protein IcmT [Pseudomonadota bacterium]